jgi:hypothetical protein
VRVILLRDDPEVSLRSTSGYYLASRWDALKGGPVGCPARAVWGCRKGSRLDLEIRTKVDAALRPLLDKLSRSTTGTQPINQFQAIQYIELCKPANTSFPTASTAAIFLR